MRLASDLEMPATRLASVNVRPAMIVAALISSPIRTRNAVVRRSARATRDSGIG
jgi:hypothetical protein